MSNLFTNTIDPVSIACNLLVQLHGLVFSSSSIPHPSKKSMKTVLHSEENLIGIFCDSEIVYPDYPPSLSSVGTIVPKHLSYFEGWHPARFCRVKTKYDELSFQKAYVFYSIALMNHLLANWIENNPEQIRIEMYDRAFEEKTLSKHLPFIAEIIVHEMRHEAQEREDIILRNGHFLRREYPDIYETATQEWNNTVSRTHITCGGDELLMRQEVDACVTGNAARSLWQNCSPEIYLEKVKDLVLG